MCRTHPAVVGKSVEAGPARDVDVAGVVRGNPFQRIVTCAADESGVVEDRVDDQLAAGVVVTEHKPDRSVFVNHIAAFDSNSREPSSAN